ncbi:MAG: M14 family zinc carboxypeptidase, partial [Candidatus Hydrogenedentes bacterium]|nr:M14 family zinc carboxypeptidase [Candidatus Hydrogenedentota bacterium]
MRNPILAVLFSLVLFSGLARAADDARLGPVYVLDVTAPDQASLHEIIESGYDVASVHGLTATIYATPAERQTLLATGWPVTEVDQTADIQKTLGVYHTYDSLTTELETYASTHTDICRLPLMNPDGWTRMPPSRYNAQGYDLNRRFPNYPDDFTGTIFNTPLDTSGWPPEVVHIMNWTAQESFTLAANFHAGALVVNYPYDHEPGIPSGQPAPSPDEDLFQDISRAYSVHNSAMWNNPEFVDGITNGSDWYAITGSMQDWDYRFAGCNHVTIEVSNVKRPDASVLAQLWEDNRESMLAYLESAQIGLRGIVTDAETGAPLYAQVSVEGNSQP